MEPSRNPGTLFTAEDTGRRAVMRTQMFGFGLVILVLGLSMVVTVRDHEIRSDATGLLKEHVIQARLLHQVQAQEDILSLALHRISNSTEPQERAARCRDLVEADAVLRELAAQAISTPNAGTWSRLADESRRFTDMATGALGSGNAVDGGAMERLLVQHDAVVRIIHELVKSNQESWLGIEQRMTIELSDVANDSIYLLVACLLLATVFATATVLIVRKNIQRIEWQRDELNQVSWHMLQTQEETARRFSHELHDELGQSLAALRSNLTHPGMIDNEISRDCVSLVDESIANVRELSQLLRPVILDDFGLEAGLRWLVERFGQRARMDVTFESSLAARPDAVVETHLFRIAQEALTNIARHSNARSVRIGLAQEGDVIVLEIQDDGDGIPADRKGDPASLGLIGMRARARECGGTLMLEPVLPHGLRVVAQVPFVQPSAEAVEEVPARGSC